MDTLLSIWHIWKIIFVSASSWCWPWAMKFMKSAFNVIYLAACYFCQWYIDLEKALSYLIIVAPMSLCHEDDTSHKTQKTVIVEILNVIPLRTKHQDGLMLLFSMIFFYFIQSRKLSAILKKNFDNTCSKSRRNFWPIIFAIYEQSRRQEIRHIEYLITGTKQNRLVVFIKV